jgi:alpha-beta hydrolase superfamily lysophospholipase
MFRWIVISSVLSLLAGYGTIAALAARRLTQARRRFSHIEPTSAGLNYEDVWFPARGDALNIAAWHIPAPGTTQAIIIGHGIGGCRGKEFTVPSFELVGRLVRNGFTVLMLDLRGHGESDAARMTYGIHERRDILGAVDWLLARGYAPGSIGVLGASMSGVAGIGAMCAEPAIGALIVDSSCADFMAMMRRHFTAYSKLPQFFLPGAIFMSRFLIGVRLDHLCPVQEIRAISDRPVLIIHARVDKVVPLTHAQALASAGDAELWITESTRHLGSFGLDRVIYSTRITRFFSQALGGTESHVASVLNGSATQQRNAQNVRAQRQLAEEARSN